MFIPLNEIVETINSPIGDGPPQRLRGDPAVRLTYVDHRRQDVVPCLLVVHYGIGEHTSIPADMLEFLSDVSVAVSHPESGMMWNIELAVGVCRKAVSAGLVV